MTRTLRTIIAPLMSLSILLLATGFFTTFVSSRMKLDGFDVRAIGAVQSCFYLGLVLGAFRAESFISSIGHIRSFTAAAGVMAASILFQSLNMHPAVWAGARICSGICLAVHYVVIESWILAKSDQSNRGFLLAVYMAVLYASQSSSQLIVDLIDPLTAEPFIVSAMLTSLCLVPVAVTRAESPPLHPPKLLKLRDLFRVAPFGFAGCALSGVMLGSIYAFVPVYATSSGIQVSYAMFITIAGGFSLQWPIGHLSDIWDRRRVLLIVALAAMLPCLGIVLFPEKDAWVLLCLFLLGGFSFAIYPLGITQVCDRLHPDEIVSATAVLLLAYSGGLVVGPLFAPEFMRIFGTVSLFSYLALVAGILAAIGFWSELYKAPVPAEDQETFVQLPRSSPVAYELDPRQ